MQKSLLGVVIALIVARSLVPSDDPGKLLPGANPTDLTLTFLWLLAAVGGAVWWAWKRPAEWHGGLVELGLAVIVGLAFTSTVVAARYKHPAWIISWEWAALLVIVVLVRQLATRPGDDQRLLAVVLATGVTLAAFAVYQQYVDLPQLKAEYDAAPLQFKRLRARPTLLLQPDANPVQMEPAAVVAVTSPISGLFPNG